MDREELYELLDIEEPADFEYFENLAALLECDEYIEFEDIYALMEGVNMESLITLIDNYFEEVTDFIPGDSPDVFLIMDNVKRSLMGLAKNSDQEDNILGNLAEEINRFRVWYSIDSEVIARNIADGTERPYTMRDAIGLARLEKIDGDKYEYDFTACLDYHLDEYIMSFGDVIAAENEYDDSDSYVDEPLDPYSVE